MLFGRLSSFSLRYKGSGRIEDVHLFMRCLYRFWYHRGLWGSCLASCVDFLNSFFLFGLILFFTTFFDWSVALNCEGADCGHATLVHGAHLPSVFGKRHMIIAFVLLLSSFVATCYEFVLFVETCMLHCELRDMLRGVVDSGHTTPLHYALHVWRGFRARAEGHEEIRLAGDLPFIGNMSWGDFLDAVCERIQEDRSFGIVAHREFDSLRAIQALMVYDNYFIALYENGILENGSLKYVDDNLLRLLICGMFDEFNALRSGADQVSLVRWQVMKYLAFYVLFYPFVVMLFLLRLLVKNAAIMRSDWGSYTSKDWNNSARWTFRLYNEVPHILFARLTSGRQMASDMILRLEPCSNVARFLRRSASTFVFIILSFSFLNTSLFISGTMGGVSFVTWLYIFLIVFSFCSEKTPVYREYNYEADVEELVRHVHYRRDEWFLSGDSFYNALTSSFLKSRLFLVTTDVARTFLMPLILIGILCDGSISRFAECVFHESVSLDGLGAVSRGSTFQLQNVDAANGLASVSHFSEKCAKSVASFSSIYRRWAARHVQAAEAGTVPATLLGSFLAQLHDGVSGRNKLAQRDESTSHADVAAPESLFSSALWERSTAHVREQLFVSEAMNLFMSAELQDVSRPSHRLLSRMKENVSRESKAFYREN